MNERYFNPEDLPLTLPVFPLRGIILLPRASLPLNIFEPRYLQMFDDSLAKERIIGILQPSPAKNEEEEANVSPLGKTVELRTLGCAGRITAFQETDDGHILITLSGLCRFMIETEKKTSKPYRIFNIDYQPFAEDLTQGAGEEEVDREHLLTVLKSYLQANDLKADWQSIYRSSSEFLVNTLSMISPYGAEEKQALLEAPDLKCRAEVLVALAEMELAARDDGSGSSLQ